MVEDLRQLLAVVEAVEVAPVAPVGVAAVVAVVVVEPFDGVPKDKGQQLIAAPHSLAEAP